MKVKHFVSVIITCLVLLSIHSCSKSKTSTNPPPGGSNGNVFTINITGMAFPPTSPITKGATVSWYNGDAVAHTVTSDDGTSFNSGNIAAGATFTFVANTAGSFSYHCTIHTSMKGTLVVNP
jgi:plastocyanin